MIAPFILAAAIATTGSSGLKLSESYTLAPAYPTVTIGQSTKVCLEDDPDCLSAAEVFRVVRRLARPPADPDPGTYDTTGAAMRQATFCDGVWATASSTAESADMVVVTFGEMVDVNLHQHLLGQVTCPRPPYLPPGSQSPPPVYLYRSRH